MARYDDFADLDDDLEMLAGSDDIAIGAESSIAGTDIIGEVREIIGRAMKRGGRKAAMAAAMAAAREIDPNAVMVKTTSGGLRRVKILPGDPLVLPAGDSNSVRYETEEDFRPQRYVVSSIDVENFAITSIKVGTSDQFAADGQCPAEIFRPDAWGIKIHFKTQNIGNKIKVAVTNLDAANPHTFRAAFIGTSIAGE